ncbi:MAG: hypothetical protein K8R60_09050 [Burkholderiales bacterium]|nr:hypothetical protein [Burkholderiales bacterium]
MTRSLVTWRLPLILLLSACGGGGSGDPPAPPPTFAVGGSVSGLNGLVVLQVNGGDDLTVSANGSFAFATALADGTAYSVSVRTQPSSPAQTCAVANPSGTVSGAAVTAPSVSCTTNVYAVGGSVAGLAGSGLVLQDNGSDDLAVAPGATSFAFATPVASGAPYAVGVKTQPTGPAQTCVVSAGSGTVGSTAIAAPTVTCTVNTAFVCGTSTNGTVVSHAGNIAASETWAGAGTVHLVTAPVTILAPATVTIQKCAIVRLAAGAGIDVRGDTTSGAFARLVAAGDDRVTGRVVFEKSSATAWGRLRALNPKSIIDLSFTALSGGGNVGGSQLNAVISLNGTGPLPDPMLRVIGVDIDAPAGAALYFSNAAFIADSDALNIAGHTDSMIAMPAMALGSVPSNTYGDNPNVALNEIRVVENANVFDNLTIATPVPIHFKADSVHVGGLAPTFVPNVTLTLERDVTLKFERASTSPTLVTFGDIGQPVDKNAALVVRGTADRPVRFTSAKAMPAPGDWAGLWLMTSNGSQIDHAIIEYAGGDASVGPVNCGPFDASINQPARHIAALLVGDGTDEQYVPPAGLITNSVFRSNAGNFAIDSVWQAPSFGPALTATNQFGSGPKFCKQSKNRKTGGCFVGGVDQSGCLVP